MARITRRGFTLSLIAGALAAPALLRPQAARAVVVGGGPAGAEAALRLVRSGAQVTLIERDPNRLGGVAAGALAKPGAGIGLGALAGAGVAVALDEVTGIDWRDARVALFSGRTLAYDRLFLAPGTAAVAEDIPGLDARTRHLWPAAWGSAREARRLQTQLSALPERGHVVLRLPARLAQPDAALARGEALAAWLATHRPQARLTVLDGGDGRLGQPGTGRWLRATVLSVDADRGRIETDAGRIEADVVNFVPPQQAGLIARVAGLTDASGWCPCDAGGASRLREGAAILGDARRDAQRTVEGALRSVRDAV